MAGTDATAKSKFIKATKRLHRMVTQAFAPEPNDPHTPFYERERYTIALMGVAEYFTSLEGRPLGQRFFELGSAIADLNSGIVRPLLRPEEQTIGAPTIRSYGEQGPMSRWDLKPYSGRV